MMAIPFSGAISERREPAQTGPLNPERATMVSMRLGN